MILKIFQHSFYVCSYNFAIFDMVYLYCIWNCKNWKMKMIYQIICYYTNRLITVIKKNNYATTCHSKESFELCKSSIRSYKAKRKELKYAKVYSLLAVPVLEILISQACSMHIIFEPVYHNIRFFFTLLGILKFE